MPQHPHVTPTDMRHPHVVISVRSAMHQNVPARRIIDLPGPPTDMRGHQALAPLPIVQGSIAMSASGLPRSVSRLIAGAIDAIDMPMTITARLAIARRVSPIAAVADPLAATEPPHKTVQEYTLNLYTLGPSGPGRL